MEIRTERLHIREFIAADFDAILRYQQEPLYLRYYPWSSRQTGDVSAFVSQQIRNQSVQPRYSFQMVITLRDTGTLIGNCGVRIAPSAIEIGDLGYELAPEFWGQGYATEAAQAMLSFGFQVLKLRRIWAQCISANIGSWRVMEKIGMRREGHYRQKEWFKGQWWDWLIYAALKEEWQPENGQAASA